MKPVFLFALLALMSCDGPPVPPTPSVPRPYMENGPELVEKGRVIDTIFRLGSNTTTKSTTPGHTKTISKSVWEDPLQFKNMHVDVPPVESVNTVTVEDQYAVVFECPHGRFVIESVGRESRAAKLWQKLKPGAEVTIRYCEVFKVTPLSGARALAKYEFVDAEPSR